jgi:O-antigen/teichoic acid export membrane protein
MRTFTFIRPAVARNLVAQVWTRLISNVGVRLLQVPLLLSVFGQDDYGRWLVISIIPAWLTLLNMGTGTVAGNDLVIQVASGDLNAARKTFADAMSLTLRIVGYSIPLVAVFTFILPEFLLTDISGSQRNQAALGLLLLCISVLITFISDIHATRLRAAGKADIAAFLLGGQLWLELVFILLTIYIAPRLDLLGAANLISTMVYVLVTWILSRRMLPGIRYVKALSDRAGRWSLFKKGAIYQSLPLGHAIILQGQILVVHQTMGAASVAVFSTARTLVRLISQGLEMVNHSVWPEMSRLFGQRDLKGLARLHRTSVSTALFLSSGGAILLWFMGPWLYATWTHRMLDIDQGLLLPLLLTIPVGSFWYTSSMVALSSNHYEGLAKRYLAASVIAHLCCWWFSMAFGLPGTALSTLIADAIMIPYVFGQSLRLTGDDRPGLLKRFTSDIRYR